MTEHPITPSPELVRQWANDSPNGETWDYKLYLAHQAARWGADQELEACCAWLDRHFFDREEICSLRDCRRPKPSSLKEQALSLVPESGGIAMKRTYSPDELAVIRRALETLND